MANIGDYMSGQKGLLDKPIEDLMARAFNTDTMKSVLKNDTARSALQFLVGDGSKRNRDPYDVMEAGSPYGKLFTKLADRAAVELLKQSMKVASKKGGTRTEQAIARQFAKQLEMEGNILENISKIATKGKAPQMVKGKGKRAASEYGTGGKFTKGRGYRSGIEELQSKINPTGVKQLPESTTPRQLPQKTGTRSLQPNNLLPAKIPPRGGVPQGATSTSYSRVNNEVIPRNLRLMSPGVGIAAGGVLGATGSMLTTPPAYTDPKLPSQGQIDQAQGVVNSDEYKRTQQIASTPNAPSQSQIDKAQGIVNSPQYGQTLDIASGTTPNTTANKTTDTTPATATATKADDDNKGGVVNWMKRLAPLIAGIGGTGIAAAIGGKDAALGYAQGFSGEYMKGQERNRQQAELERKEKRLDLKEATARMDDLLIAGAIAPAQAIFESMADQWSEKEKTMWGDAFKEAQRLKDEGNNALAFEKRMESLRFGAVFMKEGMMGPALEAINKYAEPGKEITEDMLTEMRTKNMFETKYAEFKAQNMSDDKAVTAANKFVRDVVGGYVSSEQAKKRAKVEKDLSTATTEEDIAKLEMWVNEASASLDAATIKQINDKIAEIKERQRNKNNTLGLAGEVLGGIARQKAKNVGEGIAFPFRVGEIAASGFYRGLTGQ